MAFKKMSLKITIRKFSDKVWNITFSKKIHQINIFATSTGLDIQGIRISWEELEKAKEATSL